MATGVPILVTIGLKRDARGNEVHDYPDWTQLPLEAERGEDHRDHQLVKWRYDNQFGHEDDDALSPAGTWHGMMVVTETFANEAVAMFPGRVTIMTEVEAADFWDNRHGYGRPTEKIDTDYLIGLKARRDLMVARGRGVPEVAALDAEIDKALDPNDKAPGVRKVKDRTWTDAKVALGFTIKS